MASPNLNFNSSIGQLAGFSDLYQFLGIDRNAGKPDILRAYRTKARLWHPDKNSGLPQSEEMMKYLNFARDILFDPKKRIEYDEQLANDDLSAPIARDLM